MSIYHLLDVNVGKDCTLLLCNMYVLNIKRGRALWCTCVWLWLDDFNLFYLFPFKVHWLSHKWGLHDFEMHHCRENFFTCKFCCSKTYLYPSHFLQKQKKKTVNVWVNRVVVVVVVNQKVWLMKPPSSLEFPLTFLGWVLIFSGTIHYLEVTEWNDRGNLLAQMAKKCHSSKN